MRNIMMSKAAMPTAEARVPNTVNMVKKNEANKRRKPITHIEWLAKPVSSDIIKTKPLQYNMPLRLCSTGPGASLILTHNAPVEISKPTSSLPNNEKITAGITISKVILRPSDKYWLNKKYLIPCTGCFILLIVCHKINTPGVVACNTLP